MAELKNHRLGWSDKEEIILADEVCKAVENGGTQRTAFKAVALIIGRTEGAVEFHWKKLRKENTQVMDRFQGAVAQTLIDAVNCPQSPLDQEDVIDDFVVHEITKGATKIHRMIKQITAPSNGIELPILVADELDHIEQHSDLINVYDHNWIEQMEYDHILDYINESPQQARTFYQAIEKGYGIEISAENKIQTIYSVLNRIKPNEPGYMMARGMIVMMWNMVEIMGSNPKDMFGIEFEPPF